MTIPIDLHSPFLLEHLNVRRLGYTMSYPGHPHVPLPEARPTGYVHPNDPRLDGYQRAPPRPPSSGPLYHGQQSYGIQAWPEHVAALPIAPGSAYASSSHPFAPPIPPHRPYSAPVSYPYPSRPPPPQFNLASRQQSHTSPPERLYQQSNPSSTSPTTPTSGKGNGNGNGKENKLLKWFKRDRRPSTDLSLSSTPHPQPQPHTQPHTQPSSVPISETRADGPKQSQEFGQAQTQARAPAPGKNKDLGSRHTMYNLQGLTEGMLGLGMDNKNGKEDSKSDGKLDGNGATGGNGVDGKIEGRSVDELRNRAIQDELKNPAIHLHRHSYQQTYRTSYPISYTQPYIPHSSSAPILHTSHLTSTSTSTPNDNRDGYGHGYGYEHVTSRQGVINVHVHLPTSYREDVGVGLGTDYRQQQIDTRDGEIQNGYPGGYGYRNRHEAKDRPLQSQQDFHSKARDDAFPRYAESTGHPISLPQLRPIALPQSAQSTPRDSGNLKPDLVNNTNGYRPPIREAPILAAHVQRGTFPSTRPTTGQTSSTDLLPASSRPQPPNHTQSIPLIQPGPSRRVRAQSETPLSQTAPKSKLNTTSKGRRSSVVPPTSFQGLPGKQAIRPAMQCAGYTTKGLRCKRMVKASAAINGLNRSHGDGDGLDSEVSGAGSGPDKQEEKRYCNDHVNKILRGSDGFYWRHGSTGGVHNGPAGDFSRDGQGEGGGARWVNFSDYLPKPEEVEVDEQTRVLLMLTMESPLTDKESPGFIYAYELRDLETDDLAFYKVGRTDNVPRRLDEWKKQCASHRPTPRDIFPLPHDCVKRHPSVLYKRNDAGFRSLMSGNMGGGVDGRDMCVAVKRLERLIHIELAARSPLPMSKNPCPDCSTIHKEIFPMAKLRNGKNGSTEYELVVKEVICRWERFIREVIEM